MLWRIRFIDASLGWVQVGSGLLWLDDGTPRPGKADYITIDTNPSQPPWYTPPPPPPAEPPNVASRRIHRIAFRNRFTDVEKRDMELASAHNPAATVADQRRAAALRAQLADQRDSPFIDLDRPAIRSAVQALETAGLIGAGRAQQILDAQVQPEEEYRV